MKRESSGAKHFENTAPCLIVCHSATVSCCAQAVTHVPKEKPLLKALSSQCDAYGCRLIVLEEPLYETEMGKQGKKMVTLNQKYDCNLHMKTENLLCASSSPTQVYPCSWSRVKHVHVLLNCWAVGIVFL